MLIISKNNFSQAELYNQDAVHGCYEVREEPNHVESNIEGIWQLDIVEIFISNCLNAVSVN